MTNFHGLSEDERFRIYASNRPVHRYKPYVNCLLKKRCDWCKKQDACEDVRKNLSREERTRRDRLMMKILRAERIVRGTNLSP